MATKLYEFDVESTALAKLALVRARQGYDATAEIRVVQDADKPFQVWDAPDAPESGD